MTLTKRGSGDIRALVIAASELTSVTARSLIDKWSEVDLMVLWQIERLVKAFDARGILKKERQGKKVFELSCHLESCRMRDATFVRSANEKDWWKCGLR